MSKEMWSQLKKFSDGESLDADTLNVPISQLGERTAYLYSRLKSLSSGGKMSSVVLVDVEIATSEGTEPDEGNVVYLDRELNVFAKAVAKMSLYDDFTAADSSLSVGILTRKEGTRGDVVVYGSLDLDRSGAPFRKDALIESGEEYRPGRYYLSAREAGKLTANPTGPRVFVCSIAGAETGVNFLGATALLNPQFLDIGTSHVHRTAVLTARPAGTFDERGYLPISYDDRDLAPAIRFGGTWTGSESVTYKFWLGNEDAVWPGGVVLYWTENDGEENSIGIPGPDIEVPISNGITVALSLPESTPTRAYSGLSGEKKEWAPMELPECGRGWLAHAPTAALGEEVAHVAIRGSSSISPMGVSVAFPAASQILEIGDISDGDVFEYGGKSYVFSSDYEDDSKVPIGPTKADSAANLAKAINSDVQKVMFVVHEDGDTVEIVAMDANDITDSSDIVVGKRVVSYGGATIADASSTFTFVVYDANAIVIGSSTVVSGVKSYQWTDIGGAYALVYQNVAGSGVSIAPGSSMYGVLYDDEPQAAYDYAIGFEQSISNFWPPVPPKSAALIVNGVEMDNKALLPKNPTVSFGKETVHWFANSKWRKPWPEEIESRYGEIDPALDKTMVMHWVRGFQGATGPVTSLQPKEGSPIRVLGYGTDKDANTGDLEIDVNMDFDMVNNGSSGFIVPKRVCGGKMICGPVVERVVAGPGISVMSNYESRGGQGTVTISAENGSYHNQFTDIALENAEQAKIGMFPYIRLKGYYGDISTPSAFTATMRVPTNIPDKKYTLRLQASVFGESGFTGATGYRRYATVKFSYNILPDYITDPNMKYWNLKSSLLVPNGERTVVIPFGHDDDRYGSIYNGYDPVVVTTDDPDADVDDIVVKALGESIPTYADFAGQEIDGHQIYPSLRPGNLVGIRMSRAVTQGDYEPYTSPIGFINLNWTLVATGD